MRVALGHGVELGAPDVRTRRSISAGTLTEISAGATGISFGPSRRTSMLPVGCPSRVLSAFLVCWMLSSSWGIVVRVLSSSVFDCATSSSEVAP
jgi:hypothetical protein